MTAPRKPAPPGALRTRFVLEAPVETPDDAGGVVRVFASAGAVWAALARLSGSEGWEADREAQTLNWRAEIRFRAGIDAGMRLRRGTRILDILSVADPDGRRRRLVLDCRETAP